MSKKIDPEFRCRICEVPITSAQNRKQNGYCDDCFWGCSTENADE